MHNSGSALAEDGATAVTGHREPAADLGARHEVSYTGHAYGSGGAVVNTGHLTIGAFTMQGRGPQEPALWPHQVGVIPPAARSFQQRREASRLRSAVEDGGRAVPCQVLTGMGGVGKTQLAADYAHTAWRDTSEAGGLDVLVWANASSRAALLSVYAQAGVELCRADPGDSERAARSFLAWLTPKPGAVACRWLIVLDDLGDPDDVRGLWPPLSPTGRTVVTTRRRDAALASNDRQTLDIALFDESEAVQYLRTALRDHDAPSPVHELTALASDLGHLPLALSQAAAYLHDTRERVADYRGMLADRRQSLAAALPDALPDDQALPLTAAWSLSIERADLLPPVGLAQPMLQLASLLAPSGIPHEVLTSEQALDYLVRHKRGEAAATAPPAPATARDAARTLSVLHRLSLLDYHPQTPYQAVRAHRLIQRVCRDKLSPCQRQEAVLAMADSLDAIWPEIERDAAHAQSLRTNTIALTAHAETMLYRHTAHPVLTRLGNSLGEAGQATAARDHFRLVALTARTHLGPDHPDTLLARNQCAHWQGESGDTARAAAALARVVEDARRALGPDHAHTLLARHNHAYWQGMAGDPAGAAAAFAVVVKDCLRVLGADHTDTLTARNNLARWQGHAGDAKGAVTALLEVVRDDLRVLGPDHPDTLLARNNLAHFQGMAGDRTGAVAAFADLLEDRLRVLGPDHLHTLLARHNHAYWRGMAGDPAGAAAAFAEILKDRLRVQGPEHPHTLLARSNLARWQGEAGDLVSAMSTVTELWKDSLRIHGPEHLSTLHARHSLAHWRGEMGHPADAIALLTEVVTALSRSLGPAHPETLQARSNLAHWHGEAGNRAEAVDMLTDVVADARQALGPDHPNTLTARSNLAHWHSEAGNPAEAVDMLTDVVSGLRQTLGPHHPHTLTALHRLAQSQGMAGDPASATTAFAQVLKDRLRVLGPDHPHTLLTRHRLAHWQGEAGDPVGAAAALAGLTEDQARIHGPDHPSTRAAQESLSHWRRDHE